MLKLTSCSAVCERFDFDPHLRILLGAVETGVAQLDLANTVNIEKRFMTRLRREQIVCILAQFINGLLSLHERFFWRLINKVSMFGVFLTQRVRLLPLNTRGWLLEVTVGNTFLFHEYCGLAIRVIILRRS